MKAKSNYDKKIAERYHKTEYYESSEEAIKNKEFLDKESKRLETPKIKRVTKIFNKEKIRITEKEKVFEIIKNIYERNKRNANNDEKKISKNTNLINLVSSVPLLMVSYAKVRKNKGCTTIASQKSNTEYENLNQEQKNLINRTDRGADGIDMNMFLETSKLLKAGKYPWGTSKRIYLNKPGKLGAKRPITIPPFMDRVVQEAIKNVLVAIYEPYFDKMHCSFGFRPNRSVQDAIYTLTNQYTAQGLDIALEGDIKAAYDKVNRKKLIEILEKKIADRKFIKLIENRLNYEYFDSEKEIFVIDNEGIPQGVTDSPYLWNIYMLEFDIYVNDMLTELLEKINSKTRGKNSENKKYVNKVRDTYSRRKLALCKILTWIHQIKKEKGNFKEDILILQKTNVKDWNKLYPIFPVKLNGVKEILKKCEIGTNDENKIRKILQKELKLTIHRMNNLSFLNENKKRLRYIFCRYADDWIILSNVKEYLIETIKEKIKTYLKEELYATLSDEKTLITRIKKTPAHFLGFEIRAYRGYKIGKEKHTSHNVTKIIKQKVAGNKVFAAIDKQRLIDRMHIKGYCDESGVPREIKKLNNLEVFSIIERTNSVLLGLANYYAMFVKNLKSEMSRWVYIVRYACFKTLALKHKSTIRKILKKFKPEKEMGREKTIEDIVSLNINGEIYNKSWKLHTLKSLLEKCTGKEAQIRKKNIKERFWNIWEGNIPEFEEKEKGILISNPDFLIRSNWVNIRTSASFNLPCCICGSEENIEMHHVKHVRKQKYSKINKEKTWEQIMGIRNRRQIPVCRNCHRNVIHAGRYGGRPLKEMSIDKMYDNRIINSESYIHKGKTDVNYKKTLEEKGWKHII